MSELVSFVLLLTLMLLTAVIWIPLTVNAAAGVATDLDLTLTILHTNDIHSRFLQTSKLSGACLEKDESNNKCYGGFARLHHKVKEIRKSHPNVIYLSAGDYFQGTVWYTLNKWKVVSHFVNQLNHTAMALGNHEFDDHIEGLVPFLEAATFPILSSNIDDSLEPRMQRKYKKSIVVSHQGRKIGIIGYTTTETPSISLPDKLVFENEVTAVSREAARLYNEGVKILIAVGHSGFDVDQKIAKGVPHIDLVVGGHTNTFLYTGTPPDDEEKPLGKYPTVITQPSGRKVPVVQAYAYGKYLGYLNITVNSEGEVTEWTGNPILLNGSIPQDAEMLSDLNIWNKNVSISIKEIMGSTRVFLDGDSRTCRQTECNMGNLVADAMVYAFRDFGYKPSSGHWTEVALAIQCGGGIRSSIDESDNGTITAEDILTILPFENTIDLIEIQGQYLREAFEYSVEGFEAEGLHLAGKFIQTSGIQVVYDMKEPDGHKVKKMSVLCSNCRVPRFEPLNETAVYKVVTSAYTADGGDGFLVLKNNTLVRHNLGILDSDMLTNYIKAFSPITHGLEGRISFYDPESCNSKEVPSNASMVIISYSLSLLGLFISRWTFFLFKC